MEELGAEDRATIDKMVEEAQRLSAGAAALVDDGAGDEATLMAMSTLSEEGVMQVGDDGCFGGGMGWGRLERHTPGGGAR